MKKLVKFADIVGQYKALYLLKSLIANNKVHKTFLFSGIEGIGKKTSALAFAAACNCQKILTATRKNLEAQIHSIDACGTCKSCEMFTTNYHPDIISLSPKKPIITVSDVKLLLHKASMKPYRAKTKVILIPQAQNMNTEASNTFLKFLEEPYPRTIVILISTSQTDLIPTVASRCQNIRFLPIKLGTIQKIISENGSQLNRSKTDATLSYGSLSKARQIISTNFPEERKWLISTISSLCCNQISNNIDTQLWLLFSKILSNQNAIDEHLITIQLWLRDLLVHKFDPNKITNIDIREEIAISSKKMDYNLILKHINAVQEAQKSLRSHVNVRLTIDTMLIRISEANTV